jgi:hypothetical protein
MDEKKFMMSKRFNKSLPEDFGLTYTANPSEFLRVSDCSKWIKRELYDLGWGRENGFYRLPLPSFEELVSIVMSSEDEENVYGAASIILDDFTNELLLFCRKILENKSVNKEHIRFYSVLILDKPINRSSTVGKNFSSVMKDYELWADISRQVEKLKSK